MKAMVLCAGLGTRLGELTKATPKPMLPLQGRPLLDYILKHLRNHGYREVAINLHFEPDIIRNHFGDGTQFGLRITYSIEEQLLGTAGGLKRMESFFRDDPDFLVHYGDVLTDQDWTAMLQFHRDRKAMVTLLVHQRARSNSIVNLDPDGRVSAFLERPAESERHGQSSPWVNSGVCICSPEVFAEIPAGIACDLPRDVFPRIVGSGRVYGYPLEGYRCAIDSPERLAEVRAALAEGRCQLGRT
jgi:NDP-sugar pyrophosphorylase family protein